MWEGYLLLRGLLRPHHLHRVRRLRVVTFATFALFSRAAAASRFLEISGNVEKYPVTGGWFSCQGTKEKKK